MSNGRPSKKNAMKVFIESCKDYKDCYKPIESILDRLEIKKCKSVLLKPNLLTVALPKKAVTTNPAVVDAVARWFKKNHPEAKLYLGDSSGCLGLNQTKKAFVECGMQKVIDKYKMTGVPFEAEPIVTLKNPNGVIWKEIIVAKIVKDVDLIVNLPKLKTHSLTLYTGAMKNLYGCIPGGIKGKGHLAAITPPEFADLIMDFYEVINPQVNIMDAVIGMEGAGPGQGDPIQTGYILGSKNACALDSVASKLIGVKHLYQIEKAKERKLFEKPEIIGKFKKVPYKLPRMDKYAILRLVPRFMVKILAKFAVNKFMKEPDFIHDKCTKCYACVKICPANAITLKNKLPVVDIKKCIRCLSCQEHCNYGAIETKKSIFSKLVLIFKKVVQ